MTRAGALAGAALVALTVAACSSGGGSKSARTTTTTAPVPTTAANPARLQVAPDRDLTEGQVVQVTGTGFPPNDDLVLTQCADKGEATRPGDCELATPVAVRSDAQGIAHATFKVTKGPFGTNRVSCSATQACLVSMLEVAPTDPKHASASITFAGA